jgi:hypothetical protein
MLKLLAAPLTGISVNDVSYTSNALNLGEGGDDRGGRGEAKFGDRLNRISTERRKILFNAPVILAKP